MIKKKLLGLSNQILSPIPIKLVRDYSANRNTNQKIFFMHLGKCAGTSLFEAIRQAMNVGWEGLIDTQEPIARVKSIHNTNNLEVLLPRFHELRINLALHCMAQGYQLVSGHIPYCKSAFETYGTQYSFVTVMRDPVERVISTYKYSKARGQVFGPSKNEVLSPDEELQHFLHSTRGDFEVNNYVAFFGGLHTTQHYKDNLEQAKQNVKDFHLIGFIEDLVEFTNQFYKRFGLELNIPSLRVTKQVFKERSLSKTSEEINELFTPKVRQQIAELCQTDYEVYNYAKQVFGKS
jgi:hypothetical protein